MKMNKNSNYTINIVNVSKNYGTIKAIKNVSIATNKGDIIALLGPNGAGKSTLMNMVAGYLSPTSGNIFVNGNDVEKNDIKNYMENLNYETTVKLVNAADYGVPQKRLRTLIIGSRIGHFEFPDILKEELFINDIKFTPCIYRSCISG